MVRKRKGEYMGSWEAGWTGQPGIVSRPTLSDGLYRELSGEAMDMPGDQL